MISTITTHSVLCLFGNLTNSFSREGNFLCISIKGVLRKKYSVHFGHSRPPITAIQSSKTHLLNTISLCLPIHLQSPKIYHSSPLKIIGISIVRMWPEEFKKYSELLVLNSPYSDPTLRKRPIAALITPQLPESLCRWRWIWQRGPIESWFHFLVRP